MKNVMLREMRLVKGRKFCLIVGPMRYRFLHLSLSQAVAAILLVIRIESKYIWLRSLLLGCKISLHGNTLYHCGQRT